MQERIKFPDVMAQQCQKLNVPIVGNAANHTEKSTGGLFDLTGERRAPDPLPAGFTAKGYGAMAGCCIAAVMGIITVLWYGLTESPDDDASQITPPSNSDAHDSGVMAEHGSEQMGDPILVDHTDTVHRGA
jgi:iron transport multicopper oxidase